MALEACQKIEVRNLRKHQQIMIRAKKFQITKSDLAGHTLADFVLVQSHKTPLGANSRPMN